MSKHLALAFAIPAFFTSAIALYQVSKNQFPSEVDEISLGGVACITLGLCATQVSRTKSVPQFLMYSAINLAIAGLSCIAPKNNQYVGTLFCFIVPFASKRLSNFMCDAFGDFGIS